MATYAVPIRPEIYVDDPEFTCLFIPHEHRHGDICDHASVQCQLDIFGTEDAVGSSFGSLNAEAGNFTTLCAPNCLPERLPLLSYIIEYAFIHDDGNDTASDEHSARKMNMQLDQTVNQSSVTSIPTPMSEPAQRKSEAQAKIAAEFLRLDPTFGSWFLPFWRTWTKATEDIRKLEFASLDEYFKSRVVDVSGSWTLAILQWGTGIYLTPGEEKIIGPINYIAYAELALVNDLFSWEKEKAAYIKSGETIPVVNAVQIVMTSKMLTESAAKEVVRSELTVHEERFCQLRDQYKTTSNPSRSILRILELLEHAMAGNYVWSIRCPRYAKSDRNPYRDYIETFGSEKVPVISPQASIFESTSEATNCADTIEPKQLDMLAIEEKVLMKTSLGNDLQDESVLDPYTYIISLPSKNIRGTLISALNSWYKVPDQSLSIIGDAINFLHNSSLLLDDIQDGSSLRRGNPVAHQVFGVGQTINTATFLMNEALRLIQRLSESAVSVYSEEMRNLHLGQGHDLHWSYHTHVPNLEEYMSMVDGKTGGLFRLISRLMQTEATLNKDLDLSHFANLLGRYFQIRDDYQNLKSADYAQQKGFCEDLDEGKISFPLILFMQTPSFSTITLLSIFNSRHENQKLSREAKKYILKQLTDKGVFSQTRSVLQKLHAQLMDLLVETEGKAGGIENWTLRLMIIKLTVDDDGTKTERIEPDWALNQQLAWAGYEGNTRPINKIFLLASRKTY